MSKLRLPNPYGDTVNIKNSALQNWWDKNGVRDAMNVLKTFQLPNGFAFYDHVGVQEEFGLAGWQFGNWTTQEDRFNYVVATGVSLYHLSQALGVPHKKLGKGILSIGVGVRGIPKSKATFWPSINQINLNRWQVKRAGEMFRVKRKGQGYGEAIAKSGGTGSLAHEYGHFIDRLMAAANGNTVALYTGAKGQFKPVMGGRNTITGDAIRRVFEMIYFDKDGKNTAFHNLILQDKFKGYWRSNVEVWARTFEKCVALYLAKQKIPNHFLAKQYYTAGIYPPDDVCLKVWPLIQKVCREVLK